jgi:cation diffusion facilitator CzcD-associated flavoprotein CzcO
VDETSLLVIGAGPYGVAIAARAVECGIDTTVVGKPMESWTQHMPRGMFLRSGPDWHLDASGVDTFEAYLEEESIEPTDIDPVPIDVFLGYAAWFQSQKKVVGNHRLVTRLVADDGRFVATLDDDSEIRSDVVVAAPGNLCFRQLPDWAAAVPDDLGAHTCDLVDLTALRDARVLIVGGRQSAYEWAALLCDHGAARIDLVHRHDVPRFERVSWRFVDAYIDATLSTPGWWRSLSSTEQQAVARRFWEVGRLTLEWWLPPRLLEDRVHRWPGTEVVEVTADDVDSVTVTLSNGCGLNVDRIVFATGYEVDLPRVPYLDGVIADVERVDGAPVLDASFQTSVDGLYVPGFAATRDFGPFFGFTKACPAAATIIVDDLLRRA